eukprot:c25554_g1_i1.p1 GENE.c25554_g1_i1~~c25554_g1_i1.p1  ORF type:complete len:646 (-),score=134.18 c25554_g1_i1:146-2083(-)
MSSLQIFLRFLALFLVILEISVGLHSLMNAYHDIRPTQARCEAAFSQVVPRTPCDFLSNSSFVGAARPVTFARNENLAEVFVGCFAFGMLCAAAATAIIYARHVRFLQNHPRLPDSTSDPDPDKSRLVDYLEVMSQNRYIQSLQTFFALASLVIWAVALSSHDDIDRMLNFFDPNNTLEQTKTIATWYTCGSHRPAALAIDLFVQGGVSCLLVLWILSPTKPQVSDYRLVVVDLLHASSVVWALPLALTWKSGRAYNIYMISGAIRTWRIFDGVPDLARHHKMLVSDTSTSEVGRFQNATYVSSRKLLAGQFALVIKIIFFLCGASLLLIAIEGWPCEFYIRHRSPCTCFPEFKSFVGTIYFVFTTMATVGFGDIVPRTTAGRLAVIALIVTGVYLAPTWINQIEKQHKHYRNAKRAEARVRPEQPFIPETTARTPVQSTREPDDETESRAAKSVDDSSVWDNSQLNESMTARQTLEEPQLPLETPPPGLVQMSEPSDISDPVGNLEQSLLPTAASPVIQGSPIARQGSFKNTLGQFLKRLGSSKAKDEVTLLDPQARLGVELEEVPVAATVTEWSSALKMLSKQQDQLAQQQELMHYLIDFLFQVCKTDSAKTAKLREMLAKMKQLNSTGAGSPLFRSKRAHCE